MRKLRALNIRTGAVSFVGNCAEVREAAGIAKLFDTTMDCPDLDGGSSDAQPEFEVWREAVQRLAADISRVAVITQWVAGIEANELFGLFLQCCGQQTCCNVRKFRGSRFDYNKDRLRALWKGSAHCVVETRPLFIRFDETTDVSIDLEIVGDIKATQNGEHERDRDDSPRITDRPRYKTDDG